MAKIVLTDALVLLGGYDFSGALNAVALAYGADAVDVSSFGSGGGRERLGGLKTIAAQHEGFWDTVLDAPLFAAIGLADQPMTIAATRTEGGAAYGFQAQLARYAPGAAVGEAFKFSAAAEASAGPLVRGALMHDATRTATANGTARQLGAVGATQRIYAGLHVTAAAGSTPTLNVKLQSDDAEAMSSATDRITFAQKTAIGAEWKSAVGAITDDWWRLVITIGGSTPSFTFAAFAGIGPA